MGYVLYQGQCLNYVPIGYANISGVAKACLPECATCEGTIDFCLSCEYNFLFENSCISTCPTTYYKNRSLLECRTCAELQINCLDCFNETVCLTCDATYVFYESQCLNYTPIGYANVSGMAMLCTDNCSTCENSTSYCLSCAQNYLFENSCLG